MYIVRNYLSPLRAGVVDVNIYRIPINTDYEIVSNSKYGNNDFEKEYVGTTRINIVEKLNK